MLTERDYQGSTGGTGTTGSTGVQGAIGDTGKFVSVSDLSVYAFCSVNFICNGVAGSNSTDVVTFFTDPKYNSLCGGGDAFFCYHYCSELFFRLHPVR